MTNHEEPVDFSEKYTLEETQTAIKQVCDHMKLFLLEKNASYGNSATDPVRIFSKASPDEQINVRIDDKLSRLIRGHAYVGDNDVKDFAGYLILKMVLKQLESDRELDRKIISRTSGEEG